LGGLAVQGCQGLPHFIALISEGLRQWAALNLPTTVAHVFLQDQAGGLSLSASATPGSFSHRIGTAIDSGDIDDAIGFIRQPRRFAFAPPGVIGSR